MFTVDLQQQKAWSPQQIIGSVERSYVISFFVCPRLLTNVNCEEKLLRGAMPQAASQWSGAPSIKGSSESMRMALLTFSLIGLQYVDSATACMDNANVSVSPDLLGVLK